MARRGGAEEGYLGNGTWVHARDPRYAAADVISLGCEPVTRDDYRDPVAALEGTYAGPQGRPGNGLVLQFASAHDATVFRDRYVEQVRACTPPGGPLRTQMVAPSSGLIDRRTSPDGQWTEVGATSGARLTLVILSDPGHRITLEQAEALLAAIRSRGSR